MSRDGRGLPGGLLVYGLAHISRDGRSCSCGVRSRPHFAHEDLRAFGNQNDAGVIIGLHMNP